MGNRVYFQFPAEYLAALDYDPTTGEVSFVEAKVMPDQFREITYDHVHAEEDGHGNTVAVDLDRVITFLAENNWPEAGLTADGLSL